MAVMARAGPLKEREMVRANGASRRWFVTVALFLAVGTAAETRAADPWDLFGSGDDNPYGLHHHLSHGIVEQHDLDEAGAGNDQDWMIVPTLAGHSYEARVGATSVPFDSGSCPTPPECAQFARRDLLNNILTPSVPVVNAGGVESNDRTVRWIATADSVSEYVVVSGASFLNENASGVYTIRFWDTTYSVPRWNNASGQVTVFLIQSLVQAPVTVNVDFHNAAGTLLTTASTTLQPHGLYVLNTSTLPQLANQSGHAYVSHTAGYGGLAGKAVALEPATGFSFDTPLTPIPD
jgi:hypothetical protein